MLSLRFDILVPSDYHPRMSAEHKGNGLSRRSFLKIVATGGLAIAAKPFFNLDNTLRVYAGLSGGTVDCSSNKESTVGPYPYAAIAVPGAGIEMTQDGEYGPNIFERLRLEATAIAYINHSAPKIILLDGAMDPRVDPSINKTYLQEIVKRLSQSQSELPDDAVTIEHTTINTATNMEELAKFVRGFPKTVLVVTNRFHQQRAELLACANGISAVTVIAEDIIIKNDRSRVATIDELYQSPDVQAMTGKEEAEILWQLFDPRARVPTLLKQLQILFEP